MELLAKKSSVASTREFEEKVRLEKATALAAKQEQAAAEYVRRLVTRAEERVRMRRHAEIAQEESQLLMDRIRALRKTKAEKLQELPQPVPLQTHVPRVFRV